MGGLYFGGHSSFRIPHSQWVSIVTAEQLIHLLDLKPHPEGGYYRETYRSDVTIPEGALGFPYVGDRAASTAIYYMLVPGSVSKFHRLATDEVFHFLLGDPVTWVLLNPDGKMDERVMGSFPDRGHELQLVIPAGTWFAGSLTDGGLFALMGTTVAPGFDFKDFRLADRADLLAAYPQAEKHIVRLT